MTTGEIILKKYNLDSLKYVRSQRVLNLSFPIYMIFYDSYRENVPITNYKIEKKQKVISLKYARNLVYSPSFDFRNFQGSINNSLFICVDLAGNFLTNVIEHSRVSGRLKEFLTLGDLTKNQGMSDFTAKFKAERGKIMGNENRVSKFIDTEITTDGHLDIYFLSESTKKYPPNYKHTRADSSKNYELVNNPSRTYTIIIRVLDFMEWLETNPKDELTVSDIKDVLEVSNIEIDSDVPMFYWQGAAWNLKQLDGTIYKGSIKEPQHWNKDDYHGDGNAFLDKITQGIINQISFFRNIIAGNVNKKLKRKK